MSDAFAAGTARESLRVILNASYMVVSRVLGLALALVQNAVLFRALGQAESGFFGYALGFVSLFTVFGTLGVGRLVVRDVARNRSDAWRYAWSALFAVTVLSCLTIAGIAFASLYLEATTARRLTLVVAAVWVIGVYAWQQPFESLLLAQERFFLNALLGLLGAVFRLCAVYFVVWRQPTALAAHGAIAAANLTSMLLCALAAVWVTSWSAPRVDMHFIRVRMRECFPFTLSMIFSMLYFKSDLTLLQWFGGDSAVGAYLPGQRVMEPLLMLAPIWGASIFPALCRISHTQADLHSVVHVSALRTAVMLAMPLAAIICLASERIVVVLTGHPTGFGEGSPVLATLAWTAPFFYFNSLSQEYLYSLHRNWQVTAAYALASVVSLGLNAVSIPVFGARGAAFTAIAANATVTLCFAACMYRVLAAQQFPSVTLKTSLATLGMLCVGSLCGKLTFWGGLVGAALTYCLLQLSFGTLSPEERALGRNLLARIFRRRTS